MLQIDVAERWHTTFPEAHVGILLVGNVDNTPRATRLDQQKQAIEARLRQRFAGASRADLLKLNALQAYRTYYKKFGKTYHVQLQLESVVHSGKSLPNVSPLVDANFAAELETLVLTAGHDADLRAGPAQHDARHAAARPRRGRRRRGGRRERGAHGVRPAAAGEPKQQ